VVVRQRERINFSGNKVCTVRINVPQNAIVHNLIHSNANNGIPVINMNLKLNLILASDTMGVVCRSLRNIGVMGEKNLKIGITISPYRR
jgi:hypothetical protein